MKKREEWPEKLVDLKMKKSQINNAVVLVYNRLNVESEPRVVCFSRYSDCSVVSLSFGDPREWFKCFFLL